MWLRKAPVFFTFLIGFLAICLIAMSFFTLKSSAEELSESQISYLRKNRILRVYLVPNLPPFQYVGEQKELEGLSLELLDLFSDEMEVGLEYVDSDKSAEEELRNGGVDFAVRLNAPAMEEGKVLNTSSIFELPVYIHVNSSRFDIKEIDDLNGKTVAVVRNSGISAWMKKRVPGAITKSFSSYTKAIEELDLGGIDALIGQELVVNAVVGRGGNALRVKRIGEILFVSNLCLSAAADRIELLEILQTELEFCKNSGFLSNLKSKWVGRGSGSSQDSIESVPRIFLYLGIFVLLLSAVYYALNFYRQLAVSKKMKRNHYSLIEIENNADIILLRIDSNGLIVSMNKYGESFFGYEEAELVGKELMGTIIPETESSGRDLSYILKYLCEDPKRLPLTVNENICKDGTRRWVSWTNHARYNREGVLKDVLCVGLDVTNLKEATKRYKESEKRHRILLDSIGSPIISLDENMVVQYCNKAFSEFINFPIRDLEGANITRVLPSFANSDTHQLYKQLLKTGLPQSDDTWHGKKSYSVIVHKTPWGLLAIGTSLEEKLRNQHERMLSMARIQSQQRALLKLANVEYSEISELVEEYMRIAQEAGKTMDVDEVGLWMFEESQEVMVNVCTWHSHGKPVEEGTELDLRGMPGYIKVIRNDLSFVSNNILEDPRMEAILSDILIPAGIKSVLDTGIRYEGKIIGVLHIDSRKRFREWTDDEVIFAVSIAKQISSTITFFRKKEIENSRQLLATVVEQSTESILVTDRKGAVQYVNRAYLEMTGYTREEVIGIKPGFLETVRQKQKVNSGIWTAVERGKPWHGKLQSTRREGSSLVVEVSLFPLRNDLGEISNFVWLCRDISKIMELEEILRQSQKIEAVGLMAGGIAHDYNNLLMPILGYTEMLLHGAIPDSPEHKKLSTILSAANKSKELTSKLLMFGRKEDLKLQSLNLNDVITYSKSIIKSLTGECVDLKIILHKDLENVRADITQIEQVLVNLIVNACDAMAGTGRLIIRTGQEEHLIPLKDPKDHPVAGLFATLEVIDSGCGIPEENKAKIFEPLFTTKPVGKGTGMGLSTVFRIVTQHSGFIEIDSEVGSGTNIKVFIPVAHCAVNIEKEEQLEKLIEFKGGTVLVAEDEEMVRQLVYEVLSQNGYSVLVAENGSEALEIIKKKGSEIDVLLTDIIMPDINGVELQQMALEHIPGMKVVLMSGYTGEEITFRGMKNIESLFIQKPFTAAQLLRTINRILMED